MPAAPRATRGRRAPRMSADDRERLILESAERLLEQRPFGELSIEDLARGAGISRSSFYFYFASKEAVLLSLLDEVAAEAEAARDAALARADEGDPAAVVRAGITAFHEAFGRRRAVALAAADAQGTPEIAERWAQMLAGWAEDTAARIRGFRRAAGARARVPDADIATALTLMNERVLHATFAGQEPAIAERRVVDALVAIWLGAISATTERPSP